MHTVKFVTVVQSGYENVLFRFLFLYQVHKQTFRGKCFTDDATATPPAAPSNGPHICGCLRCACGSASVLCLESVITHKDKKKQTITRLCEVCQPHKNLNWGACFNVISALYPFNEGHFPGIDTCNQLSLSVIDLQQVVIVAGGQCVHHCVSVSKQLRREKHRCERLRALTPMINHIYTSSDPFRLISVITAFTLDRNYSATSAIIYILLYIQYIC